MNQHYPFVLPPLPYAYDALEPYIDSKTMELHYSRHLQTYIDNLNNILSKQPELWKYSLEELIIYSYSLPNSIRQSMINNAGGVYNHIFFFSTLKKSDNTTPPASIYKLINSYFQNLSNFKQAFTISALSVFGSGYTWLVLNQYGKLQIINTANQDTPLPLNMAPLLNIDVWEHAYYLKHYNKRADYIDDWFKVINWDIVDEKIATGPSRSFILR